MIDSAYIDALQIHITPTYFITKVTGLEGSPPPRANRRDRAQRHGQFDYTKFYSARVIGLNGVCIGTDIASAWSALDILKGYLALGTAHKFKFTRTGRTEAEFANFTVDSSVDVTMQVPSRVIEWGATLVAADPRIYTSTLRSGSYDPTAASSGGGVAVPMTVVGGLVFTTTTTAGRLVLTPSGNFPSPVTLTITGPVVSPIIDNDAIGASIYINYTLGTNDTVVIDTLDRTVFLNGASRPDLLIAGSTTWFDLLPSTPNYLRLRGNGMQAGLTLLSASYYDARI